MIEIIDFKGKILLYLIDRCKVCLLADSTVQRDRESKRSLSHLAPEVRIGNILLSRWKGRVGVTYKQQGIITCVIVPVTMHNTTDNMI